MASKEYVSETTVIRIYVFANHCTMSQIIPLSSSASAALRCCWADLAGSSWPPPPPAEAVCGITNDWELSE